MCKICEISSFDWPFDTSNATPNSREDEDSIEEPAPDLSTSRRRKSRAEPNETPTAANYRTNCSSLRESSSKSSN
jgi:hypothetical protein